jgi:hypothetical protein
MQLNNDDIEEFKDIYRREYGEELTDADAERRARQLLAFYEVILHILVEQASACASPSVDLKARQVIVQDGSPNTAASKSADATPPQIEPREPISP